MKTYTGTCHCGAVVFSFDAEQITRGQRCTCSMCKRLGIVHSLKIAPQDFRVVKGRDRLKVYLWNDRVVPFSFCDNCGVYVFYDGETQCKVNLGCVDEIDTLNLDVDIYDGRRLL